MVADPYFNPALVVELPHEERMQLMSYEDWCYVVDRYFAQPPEVAEHLGGSRYGLHRMVCSYCGCAFAVCFNAKLKCCPDCNHFLDVEAAK